MAGLYVDTSALARVMLGEPGAEAIAAALAGHERHLSSRLLGVELRRVALREGVPALADALLAGVGLVPVDQSILSAAEAVAPTAVATLDAIHLVTALRLAEAGLLDALLTYDRRLADGARHHGLRALVP